MRVYRDMQIAAIINRNMTIQQAHALAALGQFEKACQVVEKYVRECSVGQVSIFALRETVGWLAEMGKVEEAVEVASQCVFDATKLWGKRDERTLVVRSTELFRLGEAGLIDEAIKKIPSLIDDAKESLAEDDPLLCAIRNNSARIYDKVGNFEQAHTLYSQLLADYKRWDRAGDDTALATRRNYAQSLADCQKYEESVEQLREQIVLLTELDGKTSVDTLNCRYEAALVTNMSGQGKLAYEQWRALYDDCERFLEPSHSLTAEVVSVLLTDAVSRDIPGEVLKWTQKLIPIYQDLHEPQTLGALIGLHNEYLCRV